MDRFRVRRNRARSYGVEDIFYPWEEALVLAEFSERCAACGSNDKVALDHHLPLQDGFPLRNNAVPLCLACNSSKGTKQPETFYSPEQLSQIEFHLAWLRVQVLLYQHAEQTP